MATGPVNLPPGLLDGYSTALQGHTEQAVGITDIISEGPIAGLVHGGKSIFLNNLSQIDIVKNFKNICILEFKYPTSLDKYVRKNLRDVSLRLSKNSKFVNSAFEKPKFFS